MNSVNSLELVIQPFSDGSFMIYWWQWIEVTPGTFHPVDHKTAAPNLARLQEVLAQLCASEQILLAPGDQVQWQVKRTTPVITSEVKKD